MKATSSHYPLNSVPRNGIVGLKRRCIQSCIPEIVVPLRSEKWKIISISSLNFVSEYGPRRRPLLDDGGERVETVGQRRRPRLQDERRLDLAHEALAHGGNVGETRPRRDLGGHEFL